MIGSALGQTPVTPLGPSLPAKLIRVEIGSSWGLSGASNQTIIEPGSIRREVHPVYSLKKKIPDMKTKCRIAKQYWRDLQKSLDPKMLYAFTGRVGCPACVDQAETWAAVAFSDGTSRSVRYDFQTRRQRSRHCCGRSMQSQQSAPRNRYR